MRVLGWAAAVTVLAGCAGGVSAVGDGATVVSAPSAAPTTATTAGPTLPPGRVTLSFAGDVHFSGRLEPVLSDPRPLLEALRPVLTPADVAVVNLETAITERGTPEPKQFHFRAPATALGILRDAGVDVASMANNHGVDYGRVGLEDTLAAVATSPIPVIGIGADADQAYAPTVIDVRGTSVAILAATQIDDRTVAAWSADDDSPGVASALQPDRLAAAVQSTRATADVVVVFLHWGTDYTACPNRAQTSLLDALVAAGADVVVGAHAHELQGAGWHDTAYVSYGLGNFVWWRSNSERAITTGVLTLTLDGRRTTAAQWTPMLIGDDGIPVVQTGPDAAAGLDYWNTVRGCADLADSPAG